MTDNSSEEQKQPKRKPQDPYRSAYEKLLSDLEVNHRGLAKQLRQFLHSKDYERFGSL
jgi:hypothetical protein